MPELRSFTDAQASRLEKLYADADRQISNQILLYEKAHRAPGTRQNLGTLLANVRKIRADLLKGARTWTQTTIGSTKGPGTAYKAGMDWADKGIPEESEVKDGFFNVHQQAAKKLADEIYGRFREVDWTIDGSARSVARRVDDIYRKMVLEKARGSVLGYQTSKTAAKKLREDLQNKGITGFVDRSGRSWTLQNYSRMAAITVTNNALREGTINRIQERGHDLVRVSSHQGSCKKCEQYNGATLSISGNDPDYEALDAARGNGLFHPRCKHAVSLAPEARDRFIGRLQNKETREAEIDRLAAKWNSREQS
jgi:hypothetical protein